MEALHTFVNRRENEDISGNPVKKDAWGNKDSNPYQSNLTTEDINEVSIHVLGEVIVTLNNILQQTANVMANVAKLSDAVEGRAVGGDGGLDVSALPGSMQKVLGSLNSSLNWNNQSSFEPGGMSGGGKKALDDEIESMRRKKELRQSGGSASQSLAHHLNSFETTNSKGYTGDNDSGKPKTDDQPKLNISMTPKGSPARPMAGSPSSGGSPSSALRNSALLQHSPRSGTIKPALTQREKNDKMKGCVC